MNHDTIPGARVLQIGEADIPYSVLRSKRARYLRISIDAERGVLVTVPEHADLRHVEPFLITHRSWILRHLKKLQRYEEKVPVGVSESEYQTNKRQAERFIRERVEFFNSLYGFSFRTISVRRQKTLWGSCTRSGKLQFNYALTRLPAPLLDYVVVHELCHLREHNHGVRFWRLVSQVFPDHKRIRKLLGGYRIHVG